MSRVDEYTISPEDFLRVTPHIRINRKHIVSVVSSTEDYCSPCVLVETTSGKIHVVEHESHEQARLHADDLEYRLAGLRQEFVYVPPGKRVKTVEAVSKD